jgi:polysaccharide biosynthesis/export protein
MKIFLFAILFAGGALGSCGAQYSGPAVTVLENPQTTIDIAQLDQLLHATRLELEFRPDDVLAVQVFEIAAFTFQQRIAQDGTIIFPLVGKIMLAGLTVQQTESLLSKRLIEKHMIKDSDATVTVTAVNQPAAVVTVSGAVPKPGVYSAMGSLSVSDFLSMAGGLNGSSGASTGPIASSVVTLVRPTLPQAVSIPLGPNPNQSPYGRIPLFPGDELRVGNLGVVYTIGAFKTQGAVALKDTSATTVLDVVSQAGGVGFQAKQKEAYIIRISQGSKVVVPVPLAAIIAGKQPDMVMQPGDVLLVPTSQIKAAIKGGGSGLIVSVANALLYSNAL